MKNVVTDVTKSKLNGTAQHARAMMEAGSGLKDLEEKEWREAEGRDAFGDKIDEEDPYAALYDQKKVYDAMDIISKEKVETMLNEQAAVL